VEVRGNQYLTKHEIPLGQLDEYLLGTKCVIESEFEIFDLSFGILEHYEDGLVRVCERSRQSHSKTPAKMRALWSSSKLATSFSISAILLRCPWSFSCEMSLNLETCVNVTRGPHSQLIFTSSRPPSTFRSVSPVEYMPSKISPRSLPRRLPDHHPHSSKPPP